MTEFNIGDVVRLKTDGPDTLPLIVKEFGGDGKWAYCESKCLNMRGWEKLGDIELVNRPDPQADLKQAIREVLLSDEFMKAFAAALMKTPIPIKEYAESGEPANAIPSGLCCGGPEADPDNFGECGHCGNMLCGRLQKSVDGESCLQANDRVVPGAPVGWELVGFKQIQDGVKVFDEDGDYWTFGGTNDAGDLTGALMPIFEKIEATNDPT